MTLLREIQNAAIDNSVPLTTLLRKCKVLAARLGNEELKAWIDSELNGYESRESLPSYRVLRVNSKGHFSGPFQSGLRNADIPMTCLPENMRESLSHSYLMSPVAGLEVLVANPEGTLTEPWNPDIVAHFGGDIYENMNCMQAWKVIPKPAVVAALDTIRTRILNFVLEIETEAPEAGEAPPNTIPVPLERVTQIFNTYISGNVQNVANASPGAHQHATYNERDPELFRALIAALEGSGADPTAVESVLNPARDMARASSREAFVEAYQTFTSALSDHIQIFGTLVGPFLPALAAMVS
jgi:hypothetical protein